VAVDTAQSSPKDIHDAASAQPVGDEIILVERSSMILISLSSPTPNAT
jgi:hypothetical protein